MDPAGEGQPRGHPALLPGHGLEPFSTQGKVTAAPLAPGPGWGWTVRARGPGARSPTVRSPSTSPSLSWGRPSSTASCPPCPSQRGRLTAPPPRTALRTGAAGTSPSAHCTPVRGGPEGSKNWNICDLYIY